MMFSVLLALVLMMLSFGESSVLTYFRAQHDVALAYSAGNYHPAPRPSHPFLSFHIFAFLIGGVIFPAVAEEFFFRGMLFPSIAEKRGIFKSAVITSAIFSLSHFSAALFVSTFVFSIVLSYLYLVTGSLWTAMLTHGVFNLVAFLFQHYYDVHRTRAMSELSLLSNWIPELALLGVGLVILIVVATRFRFQLRQARFPVLPTSEMAVG